jgi:hypothetical protein
VPAGSPALPPLLPNRYELILERHEIDTEGTSSLLAGASLAARARDAATGRSGPLRDVAASVTAPALIGFVAWTLRTARETGCRQVGFVARDGQILEAIAARLEAHRPDDERLALVYVHGGRRVVHAAGLTREVLDGEAPAWWIGEGLPAVAGAADAVDPRWHSPLEMVALDERDVPDVARDLAEISMRPVEEHAGLLRALWARPDVRSVLSQVGEERRRLLCRYLLERGLGRDRWAMVDLGWRGRSAVSVNRALRAGGLTTPLHLYFGLRRPDPELTRTGDWLTYLFCRPGPDSDALAGPGISSFLEAVCSADHGPVRGFHDDGRTVEPVLEPELNEPVIEWGLHDVHAAILEVADAVAPFADELSSDEVRAAAGEVLRTFLDDPDRDEAVAWGSFPYTADAAGVALAQLTTRWTWRDTARWTLRGKRPRSFWPQGSLETSAAATRTLVAARTRIAGAVRRRR